MSFFRSTFYVKNINLLSSVKKIIFLFDSVSYQRFVGGEGHLLRRPFLGSLRGRGRSTLRQINV